MTFSKRHQHDMGVRLLNWTLNYKTNQTNGLNNNAGHIFDIQWLVIDHMWLHHSLYVALLHPNVEVCGAFASKCGSFQSQEMVTVIGTLGQEQCEYEH